MDRTSRWTTVAVALLLIGTGCSRETVITVGAKNFTEQVLLGEIAAQQIERRLSRKVERKFNLGGTLVAHQALTAGEIDLYPEYTGTGLLAVLKEQASNDAAQVRDKVSRLYHERYHVRWGPSLGFSNTFAMVIRGQTARERSCKTLSEATRNGQAWQLGVGYEFLSRADGLPALERTYGLRQSGPARTMDLGLLYQALTNGQIEMAAANSTDGALTALDVVALEDDKHAFPPYEACFLFHEGALTREPRLQDVLKELAGRIPEATMRRLNHEVDGRKRAPAEVAAEFLRTLP